MGQVYLLDCTLRDGGYLNDWKFGKDNIVNIFERVVSAGVDVIEIGFLDERRVFDPERTIIPDTAGVEKIFGKLDRRQTMVVGMIDYGTCGVEHLQPCEESYLDGIRIIFKKNVMYPALKFCEQVKALGYKVFVQAVSITSYSDDELNDLVDLVNECRPYAMSMVDTYGLCDPATLSHIVSVIDRKLERNIILGYHAHNNFQLGYANAISVLQSGVARDILVDGTLYGMGKSAGNAPIELLAMYMDQKFEKCYCVTQLQEAIATSILDIYHRRPWGYTIFYYIAALNKCHPEYVSYLMNKRTLSITAINEILQMIPEGEKLGKDIKLIERLYLAYQKQECNDTDVLEHLALRLAGKQILFLGPGPSVSSNLPAIQAYQEKNSCLTIAVNYIPSHLKIDGLFLTNSQRYLQMANQLIQPQWKNIPIIATSNITPVNKDFTYVLNYSDFIDETAEFPDNSMVMFLKILMKIKVKQVAMAGFDGYTADDVNFFDVNMEYQFIKEKADSLNEYARRFFSAHQAELRVEFITPSKYLIQGG